MLLSILILIDSPTPYTFKDFLFNNLGSLLGAVLSAVMTIFIFYLGEKKHQRKKKEKEIQDKKALLLFIEGEIKSISALLEGNSNEQYIKENLSNSIIPNFHIDILQAFQNNKKFLNLIYRHINYYNLLKNDYDENTYKELCENISELMTEIETIKKSLDK